MLEDGSVVVPPWRDGESCRGVGLSALVTGNDLDLAPVCVAALGDVKVPHAVVNELVSTSLRTDNKRRLVRRSLWNECLRKECM